MPDDETIEGGDVQPLGEVLSDAPAGDPFEGYEVIPGLEHLGRAIVDAAGVPSGSPANYEATRGVQRVGGPSAEQARADALAAIAAEFPPEALDPTEPGDGT